MTPGIILQYTLPLGMAVLVLALLTLLIKPFFVAESEWLQMGSSGTFGTALLWWVEAALLFAMIFVFSFAFCFTLGTPPRCSPSMGNFFLFLMAVGPTLALIHTISLHRVRRGKP